MIVMICLDADGECADSCCRLTDCMVRCALPADDLWSIYIMLLRTVVCILLAVVLNTSSALTQPSGTSVRDETYQGQPSLGALVDQVANFRSQLEKRLLNMSTDLQEAGAGIVITGGGPEIFARALVLVKVAVVHLLGQECAHLESNCLASNPEVWQAGVILTPVALLEVETESTFVATCGRLCFARQMLFINQPASAIGHSMSHLRR